MTILSAGRRRVIRGIPNSPGINFQRPAGRKGLCITPRVRG